MNNEINGSWMPQNNIAMVNNQPVYRKKSNKKWIITAVLAIAIIVILFFLLKDSSSKRQYTFEILKDTNAFFLADGSNKYALFNENGEQLTDFKFESVGDFYGGVARVKREDGATAIIRENGSYLVDFTEDIITDYQSLFVIKSSEENYRLINYDGKTILEDSSLKVSSFYDSSLFIVSTSNEESVTIMNYKGEVLDTLKNTSFSKSQTIVNGLVTLVGDNKTYLYDIDNAKKIYEMDGTYCLSSNSSGLTVLSSCASSDTDKLYKILDNGKEYSIAKYLCDSIEIMEDGNPICRSMNNKIYHFINETGSVIEDTIAGYHTKKDYVLKSGTGLIFYVDNKERYRVPCAEIEEIIEDGYIVKAYTYGECAKTSSGYSFYSTTGEKISDSFYQITAWDKNKRAIVTSSLNNVYLVNDKLEKVSESYKAIYSFDSLYIVIDENSNYKLLNVNQKVLENGFKSYKIKDNSYAKDNYLALIYGDKVILYNSTTGEKVGENSGNSVNLYEHYYMIDDGYYSYKTGKQFYKNQ